MKILPMIPASLVWMVALSTVVLPSTARGEVLFETVYRVRVDDKLMLTAGAMELATPAASADGTMLFVGTSHGHLYKMQLVDGKERVRRDLPGGVTNIVTLGNDLLVSTDNGRLYRMAQEDLKDRWKKPLQVKGALHTTPIVASGGKVVFIQDDRDVVHVVSLDNGTLISSYDEQSYSVRGLSPVTVFGYPGMTVAGSALYAGFETGLSACFDASAAAASGEFTLRWKRGLCTEGTLKDVYLANPEGRLCSPRRTFRDVDTHPTLTEFGLLTGCHCRGLVMLNPETGDIVWETPILGPGSPAISGKVAIVSAADGNAYAVDLEKGKIRWKTRLGLQLTPKPTLMGVSGDSADPLFAFASGEDLFVVSGKDGTIKGRFFTMQGVAAPPLYLGQSLFFVSNEGFLYRVDAFR